MRQEILNCHHKISEVLLEADPLAGTSYGLGRMLADTTWLPQSRQPGLFRTAFGHDRLGNAYGWLDDLAVAFPQRAAAAVQASLSAWESWVRGQLEVTALALTRSVREC